MEQFNQLSLSPAIIEGLKKQGITVPTAIQAQSIAPLLSNEDVIGHAYTGSGKTLAYLCPLFEKIDIPRKEMQAMILAPTHELVMQIFGQIQLLASNSGLAITATNIMGEANIKNQISKLKEKPHVIVGTPGRILDLIKKKKINSQTIKTIIIDEVDNLLDNTNKQAVLDIIKSTQKDRQLAAFSASSSDNTLRILKEQMKSPVIIDIQSKAKMNPNISHFFIVGEQREKFELLRKLLHALSSHRVLVFMNDGNKIDLLTDKLNFHHIKSYSLHGTVPKEDRQKALDAFRKGVIPVLVSSDLAARGLDIPEITHIINLDFPLDLNEYIHRAGRTARGDHSGQCYSIVNPTELAALRIYQREFEIQVQGVHLVKGKILPGTTKQHYVKSKEEKKATKQSSKKSSSAKKTMVNKKNLAANPKKPKK